MVNTPASGEFKIHQSLPPHRQIADHLREEIYNGNLKPGAKLPPTLELAARWDIPGNTVQRAMGPLVKEGLLVRRPGAGTFVRERKKKLTCVGVYCGTNAQSAPFAYAVNDVLMDELHKAGIEMDLWIDSRPQDQREGPWTPLIQAAEKRRFQAFIGTETNGIAEQWQQKLAVPSAFMGASPSIPNNVDHDMRQFIDVSLRELARQGCRSVGFIAPLISAPGAHAEGLHPVTFSMMEHFTEIAGELGLTVKNDWMRMIKNQPAEALAQGQEPFGYEEFLKLWSLPRKPEGLVVFPDTAVRGVLMAIREKRVRVPEDLKLVLHKNETIDLFCPMPATFMVASERKMARALIKQVQKQFSGESCERISLPFRLVTHNP